MVKNKIFLYLLLGIFLISFASAFNFDNTYEYFPEVNTAVIHNCDIWIGWCWNEGEVLAEVTLTSGDTIVHRGIDVLVGEFNFTTTGDFEDVFGEMYLTDMKNGNEISRGKQYKYKKYKNESVDDYETTCEDVWNNTNGNYTSVCTREEIGSHIELQMDWIPIINPNNIFYSGVTYEIGVFVDVEKGDWGDWRPEILGVKIPEWAEWEESLNAGLTYAFRLDDNLANTIVLDANETLNLTASTNTDNLFYAPGQIDSAFDFDPGNNERVIIPSQLMDVNNPLSVSTWIYIDVINGNGILSDTSGGQGFSFYESNNGEIHFRYGGKRWLTSSTPISSGSWIHIVTTKASGDTTAPLLYVNNVSVVAGSISDGANVNDLSIGRIVDSVYMDGKIDETLTYNRVLTVGEVSDIYAAGLSGNGFTKVFGTIPSVVLVSPANDSNTTTSTQEFITTVTDSQLIVNVSLLFDGVITQTNTSGVNGSYTFTETGISEGVHNWSILAFNNQSLSNQSETRTFNYTQPPIDIQLIEPADAFVSNVPTVNVSCNASDPLGVEQLNLTINGVVNETLTNSSTAENLTILKELSFAEGIFTWGCQAVNDVASASSANRTLNVTYSLPVITLTSPVNDSNESLPTITFTFNATDVNGIGNVSLYIDDVFDQINTSGVDGDYQFTQTFAEGLFNWSIVAVSTLGKETTSEARIFNVTFSSPEVTLNFPGDDTNTTNATVLFNFTATDDNGIDNVSLYINGALNETNSSGFNGTYIIGKILGEGFYNWSVIANSIFGKETISAVNSFIVHLTAPTATIFAPSGTEGYFLLGANETLSYNFSEPGQNISEHLEECWYNYGNIDTCYQESINISNQSGIDGDCGLIYNGTSGFSSYDVPAFYDGSFSTSAGVSFNIYYFNYTKPIGATSAHIKYKDGVGITNISIPNLCFNQGDLQLSLNNANGVTTQLSCYNGTSFTDIYSATTGTAYEEAIIWNFTQNDLNCTGTSANFTYIEGQNNISIFARDTFGFVASDTSTWTYKLLEFNTSYNAATVEGSTETFNLDMNSSGTVISASLIYNGTAFSTSIISPGGGVYNISSTITIPDFALDTNATFFFQVTFLDSDVLNTSENTQFVSVLLIDDCTNFSNLLVNVSLFDEKTLEALVGTVEADLLILDSEGTSTISQVSSTFFNSDNFEICSNIDLSFGDFLYSLELRYYVDPTNTSNFLYVPEFYHIQKADVSNFPQSVDLYDLNSNDSTEFIITYQNDNFIFVEGAIVQLQRKYVGEGIYRVVEAPITSDGGKAIVHVDLNTNKYRATVVKDGELLDTFEDIVFNCENELSGQCEEKLEGNVDPNNDVPITEILDFIYSIATSEDNQTVTVSFTVPSGTPNIVNVVLNQIDMFGNETACNTTVVASAGSVICSYNDTIEKSILELQISKDDFNIAILSYIVDPDLDMDGINFFIVFLFMISLVGMAIASPEWMMIISVMVLMISGTLLLVSGMSLVIGLGAIAWLVVAVGIIILKMSKQEDR